MLWIWTSKQTCWSCWGCFWTEIQQMLLSAVSEETFWKCICFHKVVKVLKYSPKCVFNDSSKCVFIYFEISVLAVEHKGMLCSSPIGQEKWEGSQAGFVWKQTNQSLPKSLQPPKNRMEVGKEAKKYFRHRLGVEKGRRVLDVMGQCKQGSEVRRAWLTHCYPTPFRQNDHLKISTARFRL